MRNGNRLIEWIGQPALLSWPMVRYKMMMKLYTPVEEAILRRAQYKVTPRVDGRSIRILSPYVKPGEDPRTRIDGLTHEYIWGPDVFVCEVTAADAAVIFALSDAAEFVDITDGAPPPKIERDLAEIITPTKSEDYETFETFMSAMRDVDRRAWR